VHSFGDGIACYFMVPYNEKIWAIPLDRMSHSWISERVPRPDLARILANLRACRDDDTWGPNARFHYPRAGGIGAIWQRVAQRIICSGQLRLRHEATRIDTKRRRVGFADGSSADYDVLVSTLPLDRLVDMAGLDGLREPAAELASSTVHAVGIGLAGETPAHLRDRRWIYYPEAAVPFYRASVPSNFSPTNAPHGHWSILAEVSESAHRPIDQGRLTETVIARAFTGRQRLAPRGGSRLSYTDQEARCGAGHAAAGARGPGHLQSGTVRRLDVRNFQSGPLLPSGGGTRRASCSGQT
jgi:protoporphyrinogen oxidase